MNSNGTFVPITDVEHAIYRAINDILQQNCPIADALRHLTDDINKMSNEE